jgi:cytochrome c biogenesis protein CcmG/thiol:disulfide interchange protein DsbE
MIKRLTIIILIIVASLGYSIYQKESLQTQLVNEPVAILSRIPEASFETLDEKPFPVADLFDGSLELLVIHYWGTWCGPCEAELPELLTLIKRYEGQPGVKFLLVAVNDEKVKVEKHLKTLAIPKSSIHWLLDNKNVHRDAFGTTRVPETYVFSSDKTTLKKYTGPQEWNKTMFFQTFDEFIQISTHKL